jgi:tRNA(Arg) A34 adenosine deaminase TadA
LRLLRLLWPILLPHHRASFSDRSSPLALILSPLSFAAEAPAVSAPLVTALPDDPACTAEDRRFMLRALELARDSVAHEWRPFSAMLVKDGQVLAEYQNREILTHDVTQHAETGLIAAFSPKFDRATLSACTLYASSEPCTMCCGAIRFAGIGRVVYGVTEVQMMVVMSLPTDAHPLNSREIFARTAPTTKVLGPLMEAEGLAVHAAYWPKHPIVSRPTK